MIAALLRVHWTNLRRDRVAQLMRFLLPIAFFTIFALVFGGAGNGGPKSIPVLVVAPQGDLAAARIARALTAEGSLAVRTSVRRTASGPDTTKVPLDSARAEAMVKAGDAPVAILLPAGLDAALAGVGGAPLEIQLLSDPSNPFAAAMVGGLLQKAAMTALPDAPIAGESALGATMSSPVTVKKREVVGDSKEGDMIAFYAAGIAVMFLLFSASASAGTLLEEVESGTLDRLLSSRLGMGRLLAGKWLYITSAGALQILVMFGYAMLVFHLDVLGHLGGFAIMTLATAGTAAAFGLLLATACRTREQLSGISTLVILTYSALGGSMFPRFLMSEGMQRVGLFAFNAWALDGYVKVFWREAPIVALWPQLFALASFGVAFLSAARIFARKWETV